ncbi:transposase [Nitrosospira sp. Nsp11]|uniref:transposase n=1 Tax=Nitrosospira sp. Nsp11 TaxID=1855338 RepID=UPI0009F8735E
MKKSRFTEEQIIYALRLADSGKAVVDGCRQLGVSEATCGPGCERAAQAQADRG